MKPVQIWSGELGTCNVTEAFHSVEVNEWVQLPSNALSPHSYNWKNTCPAFKLTGKREAAESYSAEDIDHKIYKYLILIILLTFPISSLIKIGGAGVITVNKIDGEKFRCM